MWTEFGACQYDRRRRIPARLAMQNRCRCRRTPDCVAEVANTQKALIPTKCFTRERETSEFAKEAAHQALRIRCKGRLLIRQLGVLHESVAKHVTNAHLRVLHPSIV